MKLKKTHLQQFSAQQSVLTLYYQADKPLAIDLLLSVDDTPEKTLTRLINAIKSVESTLPDADKTPCLKTRLNTLLSQ